MQEKEIWKDIEGYEGRYQVSNLGRVRSKAVGNHWRLRRLQISKGHLRVTLQKDGKVSICSVHRLVAMAFVDGYQPGLVVNHKDENGLNNRYDNLEWCTVRENTVYGTGLIRYAKKRGMAVEMVDENGHVVNSFYSLSNARRNGHDEGYVKRCCEEQGMIYHGCYWRYAQKETAVKKNVRKTKVKDLPGEMWRDIEGYEGKYQISNKGRAKSLDYRHTGKEHLLSLMQFDRGYVKVRIQNKRRFVHRLVASAFIGNCDGMEINHKDGDPSNNHSENLEICSHQQNITHSWECLGRQIWSKGLRGGVGARSRPIIAIDENGVIICESKTVGEMAEKMGVSISTMIKVTKGKIERLHKHPNLIFQYGKREKYRKA